MNGNQLTDARCRNDQRRAAILQHPTLNGIDFADYFEDRSIDPPQYWLEVSLLKEPPDPTFYGLVGSPEAFQIVGGIRLVGIRVTAVEAGSESNQLRVFVSEPGDFSTYLLVINSSALDRQLAAVPFSFKASCPSPFDCRQEPDCPPELLQEPLLDYLAKDYSSFRQLMLDLIPQRNPRWLERNPADLGMVLVELLAYVGDRLSYFQDAVATEAYLDTAHQRISLKRHAKLIDYSMHDGRNAWGFVQLQVNTAGEVPQGTQLLTRITQPLRGQNNPPAELPAPVIPIADLDFDTDPALQEVLVFETSLRVSPDPLNNQLWLHTWGNRNCCLPKGAIGAYLYGRAEGTSQAIRPPLEPGDFLLLEEVKSPVTGLAADADRSHRQVVQIVTVEDTEDTEDPVYQNELDFEDEQTPQLLPITDETQAALPLLKVTWRREDALRFPLCLSAEQPETGPILHISQARGNVIPCDQGRTIEEILPAPRSKSGRTDQRVLALSQTPLTFQIMPSEPTYTDRRLLQQGRPHLAGTAGMAQPAVVLTLEFPPDEQELWQAVPHLLDSQSFDRHFVVDVDNRGRALLRFGDDVYGRRPVEVDRVIARYRIGNGEAGNLGSEALVHIVQPEAEDLIDPANPDLPPPLFPAVEQVYQPLPMQQGTEPETIEEVRQLAPPAFHAEQFRAVTEADYVEVALKLPTVEAAKCIFRHTGSWYTVFVAIHPRDSEHLVTLPGGRTQLAPDFAQQIRAHLTRYKLAGYDLNLLTAQYVPLEITVQICVAPGHFRGDVLQAVGRALSNRQFADGSVGFFHPSQFSFGQSVYLSRLYAVIERVEGVESAVVLEFKRYWDLANGELEAGVIGLEAAEIARLDNDPNSAENGTLTLTAIGGL